jgi:cell division protein FtsL
VIAPCNYDLVLIICFIISAHKKVNQLREFAAQTRVLESDHEELLQQRKSDQVELQRLRMHNQDYTQLLEENFVLRQQAVAMQRDFNGSKKQISGDRVADGERD